MGRGFLGSGPKLLFSKRKSAGKAKKNREAAKQHVQYPTASQHTHCSETGLPGSALDPSIVQLTPSSSSALRNRCCCDGSAPSSSVGCAFQLRLQAAQKHHVRMDLLWAHKPPISAAFFVVVRGVFIFLVAPSMCKVLTFLKTHQGTKPSYFSFTCFSTITYMMENSLEKNPGSSI